MTKDMLNLVPGATITDKASNFWIKPDDEEKLLADQIEEMKATFTEFKSVNMICIAAAYLQRFYMTESIFIYKPKEITYACLFMAAKIEEMDYTHEKFCRNLKQDPNELYLINNEQLLLQTLHF